MFVGQTKPVDVVKQNPSKAASQRWREIFEEIVAVDDASELVTSVGVSNKLQCVFYIPRMRL